jgi:hypothetical protein
MLRLACFVAIVLAVATPAAAQDRPAAGMNREQGAPGAAGPKDDGIAQRGQQPNAAEVRPGNRDGDAPSAAAGDIVRREPRRILGLPVNAAILIAGALVLLVVIAGLIIPGARRKDRARGGGSYGGPPPPTI